MELEFLDFELRIGKGTVGANEIVVLSSPAGEATGTMRLAFDELELKRRLQTVGIERGAGVESKVEGSDRQRALILPPMGNAIPRDTVKKLGHDLFESLFSSTVLECYRSSFTKALDDQKGLRLRLHIVDPRLANLPWEYLYDEVARRHVCLAKQTPLVRYLELFQPPSEPLTRLTIPPPISILGMIASPTDLPKLDVELEKQRMAEAIRHLEDEGKVSLTWLEGQTARDLQMAMQDRPWHVFHFIGHGDFNASEQVGLIALANDEGKTHLMSAQDLQSCLVGHNSMRLVVLNSCKGGRASETDLFSSTGAVLAAQGIPAVVSMQYEISDRAAVEFSRMFYGTLASGWSVDSAVTEARISISNTMSGSFEWGTPMLYMRANDGHLFDINASAAIFPKTTGAPPQKSTPIAKPASLPRHVADDVQRGLQILRRKVTQFWIEGVLDNSLSHSGLIDLGMDTLPEMVDSPWGSTPLDPKQPIAAVCDKLAGSLLILGVPGAGKTTIMLTLAREFIARAQDDSNLPIPVVFNLTSWTDTNQRLFDWIRTELKTKYEFDQRTANVWLQHSRLRLFLDGLDEVSTDRRPACVQAINAFTQETSMTVVVCCRFKEYTELPVRLGLNGAIRLQTLSRDQVAEHLTTAGSRLDALQTLLQKDSSLMILAQSPLMLGMMIRTYQDLPPGALGSGQFETIEARRRQLMDAYVRHQFMRDAQRRGISG